MPTETQIAANLHRLSVRIDGDVKSERLDRMLYSSDASVYQAMPLAVVRPKHGDDIVSIVQWANEYEVPLIPRAGGTSLAGQVVGDGLILDISRYITKIHTYNKDAHEVTLDPGVIQSDLNAVVAADQLIFGPDTSTANRCMIGGMIGNNACGEHSIIHGTTREHTKTIDAILSDGSRVQFGPLTAERLTAKQEQDDLEGAIYRGIVKLIDEHRELILERFPKPEILRRNTGYALDALARQQPWNPDGAPFNLVPLICGSEGTLCIVEKACLNLETLPKRKMVVCAHFDSVVEACEATVHTIKHPVSAVELMDGIILEATKANREQARNRVWVQGDPGAVLAIEFYGDDDDDCVKKCEALIADLKQLGYGHAFPIIKQEQSSTVWDLRRAGLGLLMGMPGDKKAVPLLEDAAVAVSDLPAYVQGVEEIMAQHGLGTIYYAHASVGLLHIRPQLDLKQSKDVATFKQIGDEVFALVKKFGGSISGEHGDGRLRAPFIKDILGEDCYQLFRDVKNLFDPKYIFNPHKIVDPLPMTQDLRYPPDYQTPDINTWFDWSASQGLVRATELCNGAGACRKSSSNGTMCPSYHATKEEQHTTRGRANIFRQVLQSADPLSAFDSKDLKDALDLCLSCKACASECPASVDMAKLKAEFLQQHYTRHGTPIRSWMFGNFARQAKFLSKVPRFLHGLFNIPFVKKAIGMHPDRSMPHFDRLDYVHWVESLTESKRDKSVVLFVDEFTRYLDSSVAKDAYQSLELLGYRVISVHDCDSGRAQISKGLLKDARHSLSRCVKRLLPFAQQNIPIVGLEPSALLGLRDEALTLIKNQQLREAAQIVADQTLLFEEFISAAHERGELNLEHWKAPSAHVLVHEHCHAKSIAGPGVSEAALQCFPGWQVERVHSGCCGMAGSFGYEAEHYDVSMAVGEDILLPAVRKADSKTAICAPGTSCRHQILDGTQKSSLHPASLIRAGFMRKPS
jgi:FAD/FMN-containing dehydrogenase/Fe-S oxidoreductase